MKKYLQKLVDSEQMIMGEYYVSLVYNFMVFDKLDVWVPIDLKVFCNWGTPEDLEDYLFWMNLVKNIEKPMNILIPMAGVEQRFLNKGYKEHKPALPIIHKSGTEVPMVIAAVKDLPYVADDGSNVIFIDRDFHHDSGVEQKINTFFPRAKFITLNKLTDGQASTCLFAKEYINNSNELLISACDNGSIIDNIEFDSLRNRTDVIVFTQKGTNVLQNPNAYGWVIVDNENNVVDVSVKRAVSNKPDKDNAIIATFWFRRGDMFVKAAEKMIKENDRINNEFYVDQVIKHILLLGYKAKILEVKKYIGWGTPEDYENYCKSMEYWRDFYNSSNFIDR